MADSIAKKASQLVLSSPILADDQIICKRCDSQLCQHSLGTWVKVQKSRKVSASLFSLSGQCKILNTNSLSYQTNQLLTWHCQLNAYQYRFKYVSSPIYSCFSDDETVEHFILRCPNFSLHREPLIRSVLHLKFTWPPKLYFFYPTPRYCHDFSFVSFLEEG
jgi:hypothetical protein